MGTFDASGAFLPLKVWEEGGRQQVYTRGWWDLSCRGHLLFIPVHPLPFVPTVSLNLVQKGPKEPIPEEQELDFQGLEEEEEEPSEGLDEGAPEAGEPVGWGGEEGECLEPGQAGRGALTRLCTRF